MKVRIVSIILAIIIVITMMIATAPRTSGDSYFDYGVGEMIPEPITPIENGDSE